MGHGIASSLVHEVGPPGGGAAGPGRVAQPELAARAADRRPRRDLWRTWSGWISEIVADLWSVGTLGISSTLGLLAVVSLPAFFVFRPSGDDPHPDALRPGADQRRDRATSSTPTASGTPWPPPGRRSTRRTGFRRRQAVARPHSRRRSRPSWRFLVGHRPPVTAAARPCRPVPPRPAQPEPAARAATERGGATRRSWPGSRRAWCSPPSARPGRPAASPRRTRARCCPPAPGLGRAQQPGRHRSVHPDRRSTPLVSAPVRHPTDQPKDTQTRRLPMEIIQPSPTSAGRAKFILIVLDSTDPAGERVLRRPPSGRATLARSRRKLDFPAPSRRHHRLCRRARRLRAHDRLRRRSRRERHRDDHRLRAQRRQRGSPGAPRSGWAATACHGSSWWAPAATGQVGAPATRSPATTASSSSVRWHCPSSRRVTYPPIRAPSGCWSRHDRRRELLAGPTPSSAPDPTPTTGCSSRPGPTPRSADQYHRRPVPAGYLDGAAAGRAATSPPIPSPASAARTCPASS